MVRYLYRILFKLHFFKHWNVVLTKNTPGRKFKIPVYRDTGYINLFNDHEEWMTLLLKDLFMLTKGCFFDIGMNVGQTLLKAAAIDENRSYTGFEPNPACFNYCTRLIELNHLKGFVIYPVGLFNTTGILTLFMDKEYASGASVLEDFRNNKARYSIKVNIPVFRGDELINQKEQELPAIIKIDVEGAEYEALDGLPETLEKATPFIILEILPVYSLESANGQYRKAREIKLLSLLFNLGYKMFRINEKEQQLLPLDEIAVHNSMNLTNYLFVHEDKLHLLKKMKHYSFQ